MNQEQVIELARKAGLMQESAAWISLSGQMQFASLVEQATLERAAQEASDYGGYEIADHIRALAN